MWTSLCVNQIYFILKGIFLSEYIFFLHSFGPTYHGDKVNFFLTHFYKIVICVDQNNIKYV